jgi:gas vesicle protein
MSEVITFIIGALVGVAAGLLIYRKHSAKAQSLEAKGKSMLDALKGK